MLPTSVVIGRMTSVGLTNERCAVSGLGRQTTDKVGLKLKELAFRTKI